MLRKTSLTTCVKFLLLPVLIILSNSPNPQLAQETTIKNVTYVNEHRLLNWCVNGEDEAEFKYYPFREFVPYLKKTHRNLVRVKDKSGNAKYDYKLEVTQMRYKDDSKFRGNLRNIGHFKFRSFVLRESALGVKVVLKPKEIEGLVVQVNWAPLGVGVPANVQFVDNDIDIICFDCLAKYGLPVGCRRPHDNIIHPTVLIYHHKMKHTKAHIKRRKLFTDTTEEDSKALAVRNAIRQATLANLTGPGATTPAPTGPAATTADPCKTKLSNMPQCILTTILTDAEDDYRSYMGKAGEIHGTMQWFIPPCTHTNGIEFQFLVIHSFANNEYEAFTLGPYEFPDYLNDNINHNPHIPSPFFHGLQRVMECDNAAQNAILIDRNDYSSRWRHPFDYSRSYDLCMRNVDKYKPTSEFPQTCPKPEATQCNHASMEAKGGVKVPVTTICSEVQCLSTGTSTANPNADKKPHRGIHGGINMVTNFCLQPLFIFIGRYYKETFNRCSCKGQKLWYWVHVIGGALASVCQYVGYFHFKHVDNSHHVYAGQIMMVMLGVTYVSAWIRHKSPWATAAAEFIHGVSGYVVSGFAFWCLHTAPGVSDISLILIYAATAILGVGYIIMEVCIFTLDRKFGMEPKRRHLPTIEAKLDDLPVPQAGLRILLLILISVPMLLLTVVSNFV